MLYLINPGPTRTKRKATTKRKGRAMAKKRKRAGAKRPSAKQLAARRKFAAMARARARASRSQGGTVAKRRKRKSSSAPRRTAKRARRRTGTIKSVRRGGRPVSRAAWRRSGYRRNPPILKDLTELGTQTVAALAGAGVGGQVAAMIPFTDAPGNLPIVEWLKNAGLAIGLKLFGGKVLPRHLVDAAALGMMFNPTRRLIVAAVPQAGGFLGDVMALPSFPGAYRQVAAYAPALSAYSGGNGYAEVVEEGLGAYSDGF